MLASAQFHHIGVLTRDLAESSRLYVTIFEYTVRSPAVKVEAFDIEASCLEARGKPRLELIQPCDTASTLGRLASGGSTGYHLAWSVPDLETAARQLAEARFHAFPAFTSPLWNDARCGFFIGPAGELVELVEQGPDNNPT